MTALINNKFRTEINTNAAQINLENIIKNFTFGTMYSFYCFPVKTGNALKHCRCFFYLTKKREVITNVKLVQMR